MGSQRAPPWTARAPTLALRAHRVGPAAPNAALLIHSIVVGLGRVALLHTHKPFLTAEPCPDLSPPPSQTEFNTQHPTGEAAAAESPQLESTGIISTGKYVTSGGQGSSAPVRASPRPHPALYLRARFPLLISSGQRRLGSLQEGKAYKGTRLAV